MEVVKPSGSYKTMSGRQRTVTNQHKLALFFYGFDLLTGWVCGYATKED